MMHPLRRAAALLLTTPLLLAQDPAPPKKMCGGRVELAAIFRALAERHDKDGDGVITEKEFTRGNAQFENHDRNGDGVISAADFPDGRYWNGFGPGMARRADRDGDNTVTRKEWDAMIAMLDPDGDGTITMKEFGKMAPPTITQRPELLALSFDQNGNGRIDRDDFASLFTDLDADGDGTLSAAELRGNRRLMKGEPPQPPKVGAPAPDFTLPLCDAPDKTVQLSAHTGKRPVALIFGSYT